VLAFILASAESEALPDARACFAGSTGAVLPFCDPQVFTGPRSQGKAIALSVPSVRRWLLLLLDQRLQ